MWRDAIPNERQQHIRIRTFDHLPLAPVELTSMDFPKSNAGACIPHGWLAWQVLLSPVVLGNR
jgi:hypothetical protein